jgi:hypothetical protein
MLGLNRMKKEQNGSDDYRSDEYRTFMSKLLNERDLMYGRWLWIW